MSILDNSTKLFHPLIYFDALFSFIPYLSTFENKKWDFDILDWMSQENATYFYLIFHLLTFFLELIG
jgi:hypothetical protein